MGKLNNTAAIATRPLAAGESKTVSTRQIDNGFIVCETVCNSKTGEYRSTERFEAKAPRIAEPGESGLRDAMEYLNDGK